MGSFSGWQYYIDRYLKSQPQPVPKPEPKPDPNVPTGDTWWPLPAGQIIIYNQIAITGEFNRSTLQIAVTGRKQIAPKKLVGEHKLYNNDILYGVRHPAGGIIYDGWSTINGKRYLGERENQMGATYDPCLPKLAEIKEPTRIIPGSSLVHDHTGKFMVDNPWQFRMLKKLNWGVFGECWWTCLWETNYSVYNYIFKQDVGMVDFWFIDPKTGDGYEYYAIEY